VSSQNPTSTINSVTLLTSLKELPIHPEDEGEEQIGLIIPKTCCNPLQIIWWYEPIGSKDYGIHVDWGKWENSYYMMKLRSNETFNYYHEYFHHVCDSWKVKHGLRDEVLSKQYESIWIKEDQKEKGYTAGILLGEALAERFAARRQKSIYLLADKEHPSYSLALTADTFGWEYCSRRHLYQILNKNYEIFEKPIGPIVADRKLIAGLNEDEGFEFEDELYTVANGFSIDDSVYEHAKDSPDTIPFYVHGQGKNERWETIVQEFCTQNDLSKPKFVQ